MFIMILHNDPYFRIPVVGSDLAIAYKWIELKHYIEWFVLQWASYATDEGKT